MTVFWIFLIASLIVAHWLSDEPDAPRPAIRDIEACFLECNDV